MHARMALVGTVGPDKPAIDVVIGGRLYLVAPCGDVFDFQVLEHQRLVAVIGNHKPDDGKAVAPE